MRSGWGLPPGALTSYFIDDPEFSKVEVGEIAVRSFFRGLRDRVEADHGLAVDIRAVAGTMIGARALRPEMVGLAREVAGLGFTVGVLTNNTKENEDLREHLPADVFNPVVNSGTACVRKPDPAAYKYLLEKLDLPGDAVVYVDDFPVNLPPAEALGMRTILFETVEQCRADLTRLDVLSS